MGHDGGDGAVFHPNIGFGIVTADHNTQDGNLKKARTMFFSLGKPCEQFGVIDE
jgi:hypothetical protein